ncbi:MAG: polyphosphate kinase 1 [Fluviicola sp.]|nr:polyphosphate kinase 1 [Fluviicola sp.]
MAPTVALRRNKTHICDMSYFNRELSWLAFNERVLQEAMDETIPLVERLRFLGIYSNNMDEFYRVRVANIQRMISVHNKKVEGFNGSPKDLYHEIRAVVVRQQKHFEKTYQTIIEELEAHNIFHVNEKTVNKEQQQELKDYFLKNVIHDLVPIILEKSTPIQKVRDKAIYLAVKMEWDLKRKVRYALIEVPNTVSRFYILTENDKRYVILLDDIIRLNLREIFPIFAFDTIDAYTFKFTRDAELNLDDDVSMSFIEKMEKSIKLRKKGEPVRVVYDLKMPEDLLSVVLKSLNISRSINLIPGGRYHNFKDFMKFPDFGNPHFLFPKQSAVAHPLLQHERSIIKQILKQDLLLHFPFQLFDHVVDLLREAAIDPKVKSIKINVYRVARNSQVMNALINAVRNGKEVTVVLELQARFDEENNLYWAERLKDEGAKVLYGYEGLKIHSKLILIRRISDKKEQLMAYVGTGNFNERTSQIYTDIGLLTADKRIALEVNHVFQMMEQSLHRHTFRHLMVSPVNSRRKINQLIQNEISNAKKGLPARIQIKLNNLVDSKLIDKLYEASQAGVIVHLMIRGVCCLVPGLKGKSQNIEVISIVDRYLEHTRFMIFNNNNEPLYYVTSGDWMERNLDKRIEVGAPVFDEGIQAELQLVFDLQWNDNVKARIIDKKQRNQRREAEGEINHSQQQLWDYYKAKIAD